MHHGRVAPFARDEEIAAGDIDVDSSGDQERAAAAAAASSNDVVGARARRDIVAGELLTNALVVVPPAVKSGDEVTRDGDDGRACR